MLRLKEATGCYLSARAGLSTLSTDTDWGLQCGDAQQYQKNYGRSHQEALLLSVTLIGMQFAAQF